MKDEIFKNLYNNRLLSDNTVTKFDWPQMQINWARYHEGVDY